LLALVAGPQLARADPPPPIVVVVESQDPRIDAAQIRAGLTRALHIPMVSVSDRRARRARGALSFSIERGGRRAHVYFMPTENGDVAVSLVVDAGPGADRAGRWLVEHGVAAIRTSIQRTMAMTIGDDVIDPWVSERLPALTAYTGPSSFMLPSEVIDPFADRPPPPPSPEASPYELGADVLDPWRSATREHGDGLSAPRPSSRR